MLNKRSLLYSSIKVYFFKLKCSIYKTISTLFNVLNLYVLISALGGERRRETSGSKSTFNYLPKSINGLTKLTHLQSFAKIDFLGTQYNHYYFNKHFQYKHLQKSPNKFFFLLGQVESTLNC